jgi:hypothetical protein
LYFPNLTHKTETGTAKVGRLLIATHLDQSNNPVNQQQVISFAVAFASLNILCENAGPKNQFAEPNQHVLTFLHTKFAVQCTSGVGLR